MSRAPALKDVETVFAALAHETRRQVVLILSHLGGELPSGYLAARFAHSWPTTCRHLKVLQDAGIIDVRHEGRGSHYRLNRERVTSVLGNWLSLLTPVDPNQTWESTGPTTTRALRAASSSRAQKRAKSQPLRPGAKP